MTQRNKSAAFGTGVTPPTLDLPRIKRVEDWILEAEPPAFATLFAIDPALAARGAPIYREYCAACHGASGRDFSGENVGRVTPLAEIGTDRRRLDSYSETLAVNQATLVTSESKVLTTEVAIAATNKLFELAGTRSTLREHNLDRHWRNARTHTLHDPVRWKYFHVGNYHLNGVNPPRHAWN